MTLKQGDRVYIRGKHPWADNIATVMAFEEVGLLRRNMYRLRLDSGQECYADAAALQILKTTRSKFQRREN